MQKQDRSAPGNASAKANSKACLSQRRGDAEEIQDRNAQVRGESTPNLPEERAARIVLQGTRTNLQDWRSRSPSNTRLSLC